MSNQSWQFERQTRLDDL